MATFILFLGFFVSLYAAFKLGHADGFLDGQIDGLTTCRKLVEQFDKNVRADLGITPESQVTEELVENILKEA